MQNLALQICLKLGKNLLIEGPVGVGKTTLVLETAKSLGQKVIRVDGDGRYTEQKLEGVFDPTLVLSKGFVEEAFIPGPLVTAMETGSILFINELNRMPEGVQNILLPILDERFLMVPRLGEIRAHPAFRVIATQNPKEYVATQYLSEALLDRFERFTLDYPSRDEELAMVRAHLKNSKAVDDRALEAALDLVRLTREHPSVKVGGSIRAAIAMATLVNELVNNKISLEKSLFDAGKMALLHRIEFSPEARKAGAESALSALIEEILGGKKKSKTK